MCSLSSLVGMKWCYDEERRRQSTSSGTRNVVGGLRVNVEDKNTTMSFPGRLAVQEGKWKKEHLFFRKFLTPRTYSPLTANLPNASWREHFISSCVSYVVISAWKNTFLITFCYLICSAEHRTCTYTSLKFIPLPPLWVSVEAEHIYVTSQLLSYLWIQNCSLISSLSC